MRHNLSVALCNTVLSYHKMLVFIIVPYPLYLRLPLLRRLLHLLLIHLLLLQLLLGLRLPSIPLLLLMVRLLLLIVLLGLLPISATRHLSCHLLLLSHLQR